MLLELFLHRCVLSFIGVYYITSDRKQEESDEEMLLTNADLFPGTFVMGLRYILHQGLCDLNLSLVCTFN